MEKFGVKLKSWGVTLKKIILQKKDYQNYRAKIASTIVSIGADGLFCNKQL